MLHSTLIGDSVVGGVVVLFLRSVDVAVVVVVGLIDVVVGSVVVVAICVVVEIVVVGLM